MSITMVRRHMSAINSTVILDQDDYYMMLRTTC